MVVMYMLLDEYSIAEQIMITKKIAKNEELFIVAKYLRNEIKCDELTTFSILDNILSRSKKNYNPAKSAKYVMSVVKKALNNKLKKVDSIIVTNDELEIIHNIENLKLQRLLFSLLVYAKFRNCLSEDNNNWCNININELYKTARVSTRNAKEKGMLLNKLKNLKLISFSRKNTNLNIRCEFVDNENLEGIIISDLRELGYQYLALTDKEHFLKCSNCGVTIKRKNKNDYSTKYCNSCLMLKNIENKRNSFLKLD